MVMSMQTSDPQMAAMAQSIFTPGELVVEGNTRQYTMHYKMPATDVPGTVDDWEIRAVVQNGRAAQPDYFGGGASITEGERGKGSSRPGGVGPHGRDVDRSRRGRRAHGRDRRCIHRRIGRTWRMWKRPKC